MASIPSDPPLMKPYDIDEPTNIGTDLSGPPWVAAENKMPSPGVPSEIFGSSDSESDGISMVFLVVVCIILVVSIVLLYLPSFRTILCRSRNQADEDEQAADADTSVQMTKKQRKDRRYADIESWLVSRRIQVHDDICDKTILYVDSCCETTKGIKKRSDTASTTTDEEWGPSSCDEERECAICMEDLKVGDIVSWSPNTNCEHIFHHRCVKEWLVKKTCCPCCRETFLTVDQLDGLTKSKQIQELLLGQQQRAIKCYFCLRHGPVTLPSKPELCFRKKCELDDVINKVCRGVPSRTELAEMRGHDLEIADNYCELGECENVDTESASGGSEEEPPDSTVASETTDEAAEQVELH